MRFLALYAEIRKPRKNRGFLKPNIRLMLGGFAHVHMFRKDITMLIGKINRMPAAALDLRRGDEIHE